MYNNVPCVGHANAAVVKAMAAQQATLNVHSRYLHEGVVRFAERLADLHHEAIESVVFSCTGTEANEVALSMARVVTGRRGIVCTEAAYHGTSELVSSLNYVGRREPENGEIRCFPYPDLYRPLVQGITEAELCEAGLAQVKKAIDGLNADGHGFAGLIMCSIFANEGLPNIPTGFMSKVTELVHQAGGLVIADEVQAGYARTGRWWGYDDTRFKPDIVVTGKPMGNGLPLAATAASRALVDAFRSETHYFNTFSSSPLQAAVGMAVLDEIEQGDLRSSVTKVGAHLKKELQTRAEQYGCIGDVRGRGLFISIEMVKDGLSKKPNPDRADLIVNRLKEKGLLVSTDGKFDNILKIRPPLVFSFEHAAVFLTAFDETMEEIGDR
ncbi:MAG: aminotransferase class III-fold pyridoxal phosphate-dependent enzyme [Gammaproteobacteria bacterium]|nr:aminotransferase class III-fold pyridoxal phosphate-dependent enzyme [Gammaproteobacteria bacterium]